MKCPICKKEAVKKYLPFCSLRCSEIDLYSWFNEGYSIPAIELDDINEEDLKLIIEDEDGNKSKNK